MKGGHIKLGCRSAKGDIQLTTIRHGDKETARTTWQNATKRVAFKPRGGNDDTRDQAVRAQCCAVVCLRLGEACPEPATRARTGSAKQSGPADAHRHAGRSPKLRACYRPDPAQPQAVRLADATRELSGLGLQYP